jgi:hypothetical protein
MDVRRGAFMSAAAPGSMQWVNDELDEVSKAVLRIGTERDIFERALLDIAKGRHLFGHRLRSIASDAITEAARL